MDNGAFQRAEINIKLNGADSKLSQMSYSVIEYDSIFQFYPKAKIVVSDYESIMNEYLAWIDGTEVEITMGNKKENSKKCTFVVALNSIPQQKTSSNGVGGDYEISLIHKYFYEQYKISKAYQNNISDIVSEIVRQYPFDSTDIETTFNSGLWYQPFVTNSEFINDYLLPFAYSTSAQNTPYYTFIDSNNKFNFKSFNSMFTQNPLKELEYGTKGVNIVADKKNISSVNFTQLGLSKIKPLFNSSYFWYDENGDLQIQNDKLSDYTSTDGKYPIIGSSEFPTNLISLYDYDIEADDTENNNKGYLINLHKDIVLPDKIVINTILDKNLTCGNTIKVIIPSSESNSSTSKSLKNSGIYLIESSYHIWDSKSARSTLVCSKQNLKLTTDYRNNHMLFS